MNIDPAAILSSLSGQRKEKMLHYQMDNERKMCAAVYLLLKKGLKQEYGITVNPVFDYTENGKPFLADFPHIHFNFSHCNKGVICAIDSHPVGVDIEEICPYEDDLVRYTMNDGEWHQIKESTDPHQEFLKIWTMKESYLKLTGEGLRDDMKTVFPNKGKYTTVIDSGRRYIYSVCRW